MVHLNFAVLLNKCSEQREAAKQLSLFKNKAEKSKSFIDPEVNIVSTTNAIMEHSS